jgi:hypothetical protein
MMNSIIFMAIGSFLISWYLMPRLMTYPDHIYPNWNKFWSAAMMTGFMIVLESLMHFNFNALFIGLLIIGISWWAYWKQLFVSDADFMRAMIEHHSMAIVMTNRKREGMVGQLAANINRVQLVEIEQMKSLLSSKNKNE